MKPSRSPQLTGKFWIYLLLAGGSAIFVWPFLWMASTSVKLDREMAGSQVRLFPRGPIAALQSPYIDSRYYDEAAGERMKALSQAVVEHLQTSSYMWPPDVDRAAAIQEAAQGIIEKLESILPVATWNARPELLKQEILQRIDQKLLDQVIDHVRRHLAIGQLRARSNDLQEDQLVPPARVAQVWRLEGPARFVAVDQAGKEYADLHYQFPQKGDGTIKLTQTFATSFPIERLHRLQLSLRSDDSWHPVTVTIEKLGRRYQAARPLYLSDFNWLVATWQEPGPDDLSNKIKSWISLRELPHQDGGFIESHPNKIKVTIEIKQNTAAGAWLAKILRNYQLTFDHVPFWRYVATSLFLVILNIVLTLFSCSLVAYSFARLQWPGRNFTFALMLATMMIPGQVTMIPHFLIIRWLGWYNTLYPLWLPSIFAGAFNVFLLRQFLKGIPRDLEDAAKIDGCGYWRVYWHVMLPLVRPTLAAIAIFTFMATWNDFMGPLIYLNDQRLYPLSLGLFALNVQTGGGAGSMGIMMAGSLLMTLPVIIIFFFAQRYFLQGVTLTGMKG